MLIAPTPRLSIIQTAASAKRLVKQIRKTLILPLKKNPTQLLQSSRQSVDRSWQIPQHTVTSKMASCKLFLQQAFESTRREESSPLLPGVSPPHSTAEQHFLYILTYNSVKKRRGQIFLCSRRKLLSLLSVSSPKVEPGLYFDCSLVCEWKIPPQH